MKQVVKFLSLEQVVDRVEQMEVGRMRTAFDIVFFLREATKLHKKSEEYMYLVGLDTQHKVQGVYELSKGALNATIVTPREIFKALFTMNSAAFVIAHNHPSGNCTPSREDIEISKKVYELGKLCLIELLDSIIISDIDYYSLKEQGQF